MAEDEIEQLLSTEQKYCENCPGCKVDKLKRKQQSLPFRQLASIWIVLLATALPISSLFPFLYFMIRDFDIAKSEKDIGYYAGYVGSALMFGRVFTSFIWGTVADRYGRKPTIIVGTAAMAIFNALFGLSVNYEMAIITRFLLGCFNGFLGPMRAYTVELLPDEYHTLGLSTLSSAWGIGLIVGPAVGGLLAQPVEKYPSVFSEESLFGRFPYFLPCLFMSVFTIITAFFCCWLPETLHNHNENMGSSSDDEYDAAENMSILKESLLKNWPLMSSIILYCILSLHDIAYQEIFSLWAESPRKHGGLSYSTQDVGQVLSITGFGLFIYQLFVYPPIEKILGPVMFIRIGGVISLLLLTFHPFLTAYSGPTLSLLINFVSMGRNLIGVSLITAVFILQSKAVEQHQRGAANGLAMTAMSVFKTIGPACAGTIFSWAQKRQDSNFLPGDHMVFFILNVVEAIAILMSFKPFLVQRMR